MKIVSWNIDGLNAALTSKSNRALLSQKTLRDIASYAPDIIGLQETKLLELTNEHLEELNKLFPDYTLACSASENKKGYSGTMLLVHNKHKVDFNQENPLYCAYHDMPFYGGDPEGRVITARIKDVVYVTVYTPNIGRGHERIEYRKTFDTGLAQYIKGLHKQGLRVVLFGDFNVARHEIDLKNPKGNIEKPGFTQMERDLLENIVNAGVVDAYRQIHPDTSGHYTWFTQLSKTAKLNNSGWRIDYFLVSESLADLIDDVGVIDTGERKDHSPIYLQMKKGA